MPNAVEAKTKTVERIVLLVAGLCGCIGTTLATALIDYKFNPSSTLRKYLTTENNEFSPSIFTPVENIAIAGWDISEKDIWFHLSQNGVLEDKVYKKYKKHLLGIPIIQPPRTDSSVKDRVDDLRRQIVELKKKCDSTSAVFVNLLPAGQAFRYEHEGLEDLYSKPAREVLPDLLYAIACLEEGIPIINFNSNSIAHPALISLARKRKTPVCGSDGKTGQTYFKMVIASAIASRRLYVDGWYSLNILGNSDGYNLSNPKNAETKIKNKTGLLNQILGYNVGENYPIASHVVRIDYYPPRGDSKEAWDVIDLKGIFDLPMSLRINFQGRDSILAAPLVIDLCRWLVLMKRNDLGGFCDDLAFYFKTPLGTKAPYSFDEQINSLKILSRKLSGGVPEGTKT